jgi:hypothetical protein
VVSPESTLAVLPESAQLGQSGGGPEQSEQSGGGSAPLWYWLSGAGHSI